jgi:hypothetical protein
MLAQKAAEAGAKPDVIWHSGNCAPGRPPSPTGSAAIRSQHLLQRAGCSRPIPTGWIVDAIAGDDRHIMLAGHFPYLPRLLGRLQTGMADAMPADFPLNGVVALEQVEGRWVERWRLRP